ncbi:MAG TPA: Crp/Fnr family transcriptional regulator [Lachnospiraceae bacterium]|nr:Crp/Fnr family transcriptional regulator [Lachnospiraceae bacterium]
MNKKEELAKIFPVWNKLSDEEKETLTNGSSVKTVKEGAVIHNGDEDCIGLLLIKKGIIRIYILNENGREITLYRLFDRDMCLFSASCIMNSIQFDVKVEAETDVEMIVIKAPVYEGLMQKSLVVANYTNELMAARFSEVMWLMEQIMFKSFDVRLAEFLYQQMNIEQNSTISITHEKIARHMGTAREVVTRMLKYFQGEKMVRLFRGGIEIIDEDKIRKMFD